MMQKNVAIRRLLARRLSHVKSIRFYHASGKVGADALDMVDTFARRHSEYYSRRVNALFGHFLRLCKRISILKIFSVI